MKTRIFDFIRTLFKIQLFEKLLVKLTINETFGSPISKFPPNHYQYKSGTIRKVIRNGISYKLDISDIVDWFIYYGFKEKSRQRLLSLMQAGQTIFDIGTNVGNVTLEAAKAVGSSGKIHSFEPDAVNFERLQSNLKLNNFSNISANKLGLGDKPGQFTIANVSPGNKGMNRIIKEESADFKSSQIQVTTIDKYVEEKNINTIDLIKIDVEGFEYNVLKGGTRSIEKFHPTFFIELDDNNLKAQGISAQELIDLLASWGYGITHAETEEKIDSNFKFENCHFDIIAKYSN